MITRQATARGNRKPPTNLGSKAFIANKYAYYKWLREEAPVYKGKISIINAYFLSRYDDCVHMLKDPRFIRNRTTATGGGRSPFPLPKSIALIANNMILEDEPEHRRLRNLVHKAFTPHALARLEERIEHLTHELLDAAEKQGSVDLIRAYCLPIPITVISEMVGVSDQDMPRFRNSIRVMTGWDHN
jgi:cytochrome P450